MKRKVLAALALLLAVACFVSAEPVRQKGDLVLSGNLTLMTPLARTFSDNAGETAEESGKMGITEGGGVTVSASWYATPHIAIGGETGWRFHLSSTTGKLFSNFPVLFDFTYVPFSRGKVELPLSLKLGINVLTYEELASFSMEGDLTFGFRYSFNDSVAIGAETGVSFIPELFVSEEMKKFNTLYTYLPLTLSVSWIH